MLPISRILCASTLLLTSLVCLLVCPYTKVEESFNLQAAHDLYYYGIDFPSLFRAGASGVADETKNNSRAAANLYDHLSYPGVVPRTFFGPLVLSYMVKVVRIFLFPFLDISMNPRLVQLLTRLILMLFNVHAFVRLANSAERALHCLPSSSPRGQFIGQQQQQSHLLGNYFLLICACQFHIPFYISRTLPNIFATILVTHCFAEWFRGHNYKASAWLVAATAIFRCDMLILLFTVGTSMLLLPHQQQQQNNNGSKQRRQMSLTKAVWTGVLSGSVSLLLTVPLDSLLWQRLVWPEGEVLFFNTVENRSGEWGTSPWYWYFSSALPKTMLLTCLLVPFSFLRLAEWVKTASFLINNVRRRQGGVLLLPPPLVMRENNITPYLVPVLAFVGLYSLLPHKEVRFLFPVLSMFNIAAALGITRLHTLAFPTSTLSDDEKSKYNKKNSGRHYLYVFIYVCGMGTMFVSLLGSAMNLTVSHYNYPGGEALALLEKHVSSTSPSKQVHVHIDVASAMTGVSLFGQRSASATSITGWKFEKAGYETENDVKKSVTNTFTHLLSEEDVVEGFHIMDTAQGSPRVSFKRFKILTEDSVFVLEQDGCM